MTTPHGDTEVSEKRMPARGAGPATADRDAALDARYGRTPTARRSGRVLVWVGAAAFIVVFAAWVVWGGLDGSGDTIDVLDTGFSDITDTSVDVTWQLTVEPGLTTTCAVQAQNQAHGIVGWKIVEVPASDLRTRAFTETVATTERAVTGLIYRCWLP